MDVSNAALFEHGHIFLSCKYQCVLGHPFISFFIVWIAVKIKYTTAAVLLLPWTLQVSCGKLQQGWFANPETSTSYLLSPSVTYPWSHKTLLKPLFPGLLTNPFGNNVVGKWGTKHKKRLRKKSVTKIIVPKTMELQYSWRVTQIRNNMELTHLPQISLNLLVVYHSSYFCHLFLRNNLSFLRYVCF